MKDGQRVQIINHEDKKLVGKIGTVIESAWESYAFCVTIKLDDGLELPIGKEKLKEI